MSRHISKHKALLIISDTGMYKNKGELFAFGPVVREIDELQNEYENITWIGFNRPDEKENKSYKKIQERYTKVIFLKKVGGKSLNSKLKILMQYPSMFKIINSEVKKHNYIHSRAPSQPALLAMFLSLLYFKKKFWFKYAGSWVDKTSFYYRFQRFVLKHLRSNAKITINGKWPNQKSQVITFENPCLSSEDRVTGLEICKKKKAGNPFEFCFVGNLDKNKGVDLLFEALRDYNSNNIKCVHIVGNGVLYLKLIEIAKELNVNILFHGFLSKEALIPIYQRSSFIILPSKSEGFPKVIGEAMNYGCIPIVTDISCISQYIVNDTNGYLIESAQILAIKDAIKCSLSTSPEKQEEMVVNNYKKANCFTYSYYVQRITTTVFN